MLAAKVFNLPPRQRSMSDKPLTKREAAGARLARAPTTLSVTPLKYTKVIHFIRHGEGFHNVAGHVDHENYKGWEWEDAHLTANGWRQAEALGRHMRGAGIQVDLVVCSPMTRTLETAVGIFGRPAGAAPYTGEDGPGPATTNSNSGDDDDGGAGCLMRAQSGVPNRRVARSATPAAGCPPFLALEGAREQLGVHPCDRRGAVSDYKCRFPGVDFSQVATEEDTWWFEDVREPHADLRGRGLALLQALMQRPERHIALVTHSTWLHFTLSQFGRDHGRQHTDYIRWFENCEMRSLVLADIPAVPGTHAPDPTHFPGGTHGLEGSEKDVAEAVNGVAVGSA